MPFRAPKRETSSNESEGLLLNNPTEGKFIAYYPGDGHHPAYWKVSSAAGTTRVFDRESLQVPDSATRRGEMDAEWRLRTLLRDLQALASEPHTLIAAYDSRVPVVYELFNDFKIHLEWAIKAVREGRMTEEMWNMARAVDARLGEMTDISDPSRWTAETLRLSPTWQDVRLFAQKVLVAMGRPLEPPPRQSM